MAEGGEGWDEVTYLRKKTPKGAEAKSKKVSYTIVPICCFNKYC